MVTINSSSEFKGIQHMFQHDDAIRIESVESTETNTGNYDEREDPLKQGNSISTYDMCIHIEVNAEAENINEALHTQNYRDDKCWINAEQN